MPVRLRLIGERSDATPGAEPDCFRPAPIATFPTMIRGQQELESDVAIPFPGFKLQGELIIPQNAPGLVLFAHGSGSSRHSPRNQYVARTLRERGLGTLLFDLLTADEEQEERHTGHLRFDIQLLGERLLGATHWVHKEQPDLLLGYFGASTGGAAALVAAARSEVAVAAIVSRGGRPDLAGPALPRVRAATLLIVGGMDTTVIELNKQAYAQMQCPRELRLIPGATHLFEETGALERVAEMAAEWFARHLAAGSVRA
jgi:putative phosphoribosyl transferase